MNAVSPNAVLPFSAKAENSLHWQVLCITNSAQQLGRSLGRIEREGHQFDALSEAERHLAEQAGELSEILEKLAADLNALRSRYL